MGLFSDLTTGRTIVALAPFIDGEAFIVATANDLFELHISKKRVTLLKFIADEGPKRTFGELVDQPIVAMTTPFQNHTVYVATSHDLFEVNFVTRRVALVTTLSPAVNFVDGPIPAPA
jgi:hypothetical protein